MIKLFRWVNAKLILLDEEQIEWLRTHTGPDPSAPFSVKILEVVKNLHHYHSTPTPQELEEFSRRYSWLVSIVKLIRSGYRPYFGARFSSSSGSPEGARQLLCLVIKNPKQRERLLNAIDEKHEEIIEGLGIEEANSFYCKSVESEIAEFINQSAKDRVSCLSLSKLSRFISGI